VAFPRFDSTLKLTAKAATTKAEDENNVFSMASTKDKRTNNKHDQRAIDFWALSIIFNSPVLQLRFREIGQHSRGDRHLAKR
jgi:aminopeptidase C